MLECGFTMNNLQSARMSSADAELNTKYGNKCKQCNLTFLQNSTKHSQTVLVQFIFCFNIVTKVNNHSVLSRLKIAVTFDTTLPTKQSGQHESN